MRDKSEKEWISKVSRKLTDQKATNLSLIFFVLGVSFYVIPMFWPAISPALEKFFENVAFGLLFPSIFTFIWERTVAPQVADEIIAKIRLKKSVDDIGIETISLNNDEMWDDILSTAQNMEVYFDLDGAWWLTHRTAIQKAISRGCKVRVVVLDASDSERRKVAESIMDFQKNLRDESTSQTDFYFKSKVGKCKVEVRRSKSFPLNSAIVINDLIYFRINRVNSFESKFLCVGTPTNKGLGLAIRTDLDNLWKNSIAA